MTDRVVALAAALRARGVVVGVGETVAALRALAAVDPAAPAQAYVALRAVLCSSHAAWVAFEEAFAEVFGSRDGEQGAQPAPPPLPPAASELLPRAPAAAPGAGRPEQQTVPPAAAPAAWSEVELLRRKPFVAYTGDDRAAARRILARLAVRGPTRPSRRTRVTRRRGTRPDLRRTLRASLRHGGEPIERRWREPGTRPRELVLVLDASGSMTPYARALFDYVQAAVAGRRRVEAFAFGTRLTRVTRELAGRDPDAALARATAAGEDWAAGTRIGAALATLNRVHGRRVGRGSVAVILSDGWDLGSPALLAQEMARLRRTTHALIWLNPLKAQPDYEPLARGMQTALPHVDHFLTGHSLAALEELVELLEGDPGHLYHR